MFLKSAWLLWSVDPAHSADLSGVEDPGVLDHAAVAPAAVDHAAAAEEWEPRATAQPKDQGALNVSLI